MTPPQATAKVGSGRANGAGGLLARLRSGLPLPWLLGLLGWFSLTVSGRIGNVDASVMLDLSRALLRGSVALPADCETCATGTGGTLVSPYGLAPSAYWMPFVLLGRAASRLAPSIPPTMWEEFFVSFANVPVITLLLLYLALAWRRAGAPEGRIRQGLVLFALATPLGPYAKLPFSDPLMALALFAAWFHWNVGGRPSSAAIAGCWLGAALLSRRQADSVVPVLVLLWLVESAQGRSWQRFGVCLLGVLPALAIRLAYNTARFGDPWTEDQPGIRGVGMLRASGWQPRLVSVLFSDWRGLATYGLVPLGIAALSLRKMHRASPRDAITLVVVVVSGIGFLTALPFGPGVSFGPRYALYLLPFLALAWPYFTVPKPLTIRFPMALAAGFSVWLMAGGTALDMLPVAQRARWMAPPGRQFKALAGEWRRVLSPGEHPDLPQLEASPVWRHAPFERPDFWWCHLWALRQRSNR